MMLMNFEMIEEQTDYLEMFYSQRGEVELHFFSTFGNLFAEVLSSNGTRITVVIYEFSQMKYYAMFRVWKKYVDDVFILNADRFWRKREVG